MYNEKQKRSFIKSHTDSEKTADKIAQIFSWFEPYEKEWEMDLSQQCVEKLQPAVNELTGVRSKSTETVLIILKEYVKWCEYNGFYVSRGVFEVKIDTIEKIRKQMVSSPLSLKNLLDERFEKPEEGTVDITYRVFLWMAFAGLDDKDAVRVTADCVDLENLRINFEGHSYELYIEAKEDFKKACLLTEFVYKHPNYTTRRDRAPGDVIMRGIKSSNISLSSLRPMINKKLDEDNSEKNADERRKSGVSYKRLYLSGIFYRAYQREMAGLPVDFSTIIASSIARKEKVKKYTTTKTRTINKIANLMEREYMEDYKKWKYALIP